jgi:hypothetical protein
MKRPIYEIVAFLVFFVFLAMAQQTEFVPKNLSGGEMVYYIVGQELYHEKTCPEIAGKNAFAATAWTMEWLKFKPCPKCLYKEIAVPAKAKPAQTELNMSGFGSVARWEGAAQKNTETFTVNANEWIINWETTGDSNFIIEIFKADTNEMVELVANIVGSGKDSSVIRGKGQYYLKIMSSQPYKIEVVEKK